MRYLVIALLIILAACQPYTYNGNPDPYRGPVSAIPSWSENCGTPDAPKRCPSYRPRPQQVSAPLPDYN
jgi:hypothetical protein